MNGYSYQMWAGDDRIWVFKDGVWLGWLNRKSGKIIPALSEDETSAMLRDALKRRPSSGEL